MNWLESSDAELESRALLMWANYIETGNVTLSANDAANMKLKLFPLDIYQMKLVIRLRELAGQTCA